MSFQTESSAVLIQFDGRNYFSRARMIHVPCSIWIFVVAMFMTFLCHAQPSFIQNPQSETVPAGQRVSITVVAEGQTRLHYYWRFNGRKLPVRGHTLRFKATLRRAGTYEAMARDRYGRVTVSAPAVIDVESSGTTPPPVVQPPSGSQPLPVILLQPQDVSVPEHGTAVFQVILNNSGSYTTIIWHNDNPLEGSHQIPDTIGLDVRNTRLQIPNCLNADNYNGFYWIAVTNQAGGTVSRKARLTVIPAQ